MDEKLYRAIVDGIKESVLRVRKKPPTDYYSNTHIISERNLELDFDNLLGGPPDFIRIETDKDCTLDYKVKKGKESFYRNYPEGIDADDPIRIRQGVQIHLRIQIQ